ncbi:YbfB/YjiJ family MFS transporter [Ignatzschineria sp. LJL83]
MKIKNMIFSIIILMVGMGFGRFLYTAMMPVLLKETQFSFDELSYIASSNYLGYLLGAILLSFSIFHSSQYLKVSLVFSLLSTAFFLYLLSVTTSFADVFSIRFLAGVSSAGAIIYGSITIIKYFSSSFMTATFFSGVGLGIVVGNELGIVVGNELVNLALERQYSSEMIWFYISLFAFILSAYILLFFPKKESENRLSEENVSRETQTIAHKKDEISWISLIILYGFAGYGYIIIATYLPVIAQSLPQSLMTDHLWSLVGVGAIFSCYLWLFIERKVGVITALFFNLLLQSTFVFLSIFSNSIGLLMMSSLGLGLTFMGTTSLVMPLARRLKSLKIFNLVGLVTLTYGIGQILGPMMTSLIQALTGSLLLAIISGAISLLIASLIVLYEKIKSAKVTE